MVDSQLTLDMFVKCAAFDPLLDSPVTLDIFVNYGAFYLQPARVSSRHKGKRPRYAEPGASGSDEDGMEMEESDQEEAPLKLPKLSQQGTPSESKRRKR